jgi:hypothetical protein
MSPASIEGRLDLGCIAAHGHFTYDGGAKRYVFTLEGRPATAFLFNLISQLQFSGTVPMIDVQASRRYASGEIDWTGRISKCGDAMLRSYLYEAANVLLTRVVNRDSPDAPGTGLNIGAFPAFPQGRREVRMATRTSGSPQVVEGSDLAIFPGIGDTPLPSVARERMNIEPLTLALVVVAAAVPR